MLFLRFSSVFAVAMMVQGLSATLFQCPKSGNTQPICSQPNGDKTDVEKAYPDGIGYSCSSNFKYPIQKCCTPGFKTGATHPGISTVYSPYVTKNCQMAVVTSFQCPNPDQAQALCSLTAGSTTTLVKPFPNGGTYFCPADLVVPAKNCCRTDFKLKYLFPGNSTSIPVATFAGVCTSA